MKIGFGLYRNLLNKDNYKFVNQIGATHIVAHLTNYFSGSNPTISSGGNNGWGVCDNEPIWDIELFSAIKKEMEDHGLIFEAIESVPKVKSPPVTLKSPAIVVFPLVAFTVNLSVLIAKSPVKAVFPLEAATVNLSVFTAKFPVELKLVFVLNEPSTVIALPDSETIESDIICVPDHFVRFPTVPVPST